MKITVIGSGYVGLVQAVCLADMGNMVVCLDRDIEKINGLNKGIIPIYEASLEGKFRTNVLAKRLVFTTDIQLAVEHGDVQFIAVGTPPSEDGSADLAHVLAVAKNIAMHMNRYVVIANKSTVPVGTADLVTRTISAELARLERSIEFDVVSNPEFLREGVAVEDFMRPSRVVIGTSSDKAYAIMEAIYKPFTRSNPRILRMTEESAEFDKYASNVRKALMISTNNELAILAESLGADYEEHRISSAYDKEIGAGSNRPGPGHGGDCFEKDTHAICRMAADQNVNIPIVHSGLLANTAHKHHVAKKVIKYFDGDIANKKIAVWGLAFKSGTDDMRNAPSIVIIQDLILAGATVVAYDPMATDRAKQIFTDSSVVTFAPSSIEALDGVDALIIVTEWKEFRSPDFEKMAEEMGSKVIFDTRNMYDLHVPPGHGFTYISNGRPVGKPLEVK